MICTAFNNLKSLSVLQKSPSTNIGVTWLLFQLTPSSWTRQSTTISSVQMFAAQKQTKQIPLGQAWPGQPGSSFALWVDCTLLTISLTCHLESHTHQAAFTDIVTKQWKWCFVEFVDVQWKWNDENWNRHTSAVQGVALRTGYHDPLWQLIFWTLLNTPPLFSETYDFVCQKCVLKFFIEFTERNEIRRKWAPKKEGKSKGSFLSGHPKKSLEDPIVVAQGDTKVPSQGAPASTWVLS